MDVFPSVSFFRRRGEGPSSSSSSAPAAQGSWDRQYWPSRGVSSSSSSYGEDRGEGVDGTGSRWLIGFPRTVASASLFSRIMEQVYTVDKEVEPTAPLVDMPKGRPPPLQELFPDGDLSGHVCVVGPTGSGKSTIVRGILCALSERATLSIYSLEFPVEVSLNTHGLFHACQIDMFQQVGGKQRSLQDTANSLLRHDPDLMYFGELRTKTDFETATSISLSGVACISTGHAHSPMDLLERLRAMNIDLSTQFRALRCIVGVKRVPILCTKCKKTVILQGKIHNRALRLFFLYRIVTLGRDQRRQVAPRVCVPGDSRDCTCSGGYSHNHTIYEFLHIHPGDTLESLRQHHSYTTEETLLSLVMEGQVSPYFLESSL